MILGDTRPKTQLPYWKCLKGSRHLQEFLIAKGDSYQANSAFINKHMIDVAPTILKNLNIKIPNEMKGKAI
jgi:bisphosphoglycerate-independent phosphoglycerate mutase (AlkP superfamily)